MQTMILILSDIMNFNYSIYLLGIILILLILVLIYQISNPPKEINIHPKSYQDHSSLVNNELYIIDTLEHDRNFNSWLEENNKL